MQQNEQPTTTYKTIEPTVEQTAPVRSHGATFHLHLPDAKKLLPVSPRIIVRMVGAWLVLLIVLNLVVSNMADKPHLSQSNPVSAGKMRAQLSLDEERHANIDSLQVYLDKYYEQFATYPSTDQINSIEFRKADPAFKVANRRTYMDPKGANAVLTLTPVKNSYYYAPTPVGCDSSKVMCSGYSMGATLENGQLYTKLNSK